MRLHLDTQFHGAKICSMELSQVAIKHTASGFLQIWISHNLNYNPQERLSNLKIKKNQVEFLLFMFSSKIQLLIRIGTEWGKSTVLAAFARASKNIKLAMKTTICKVQGLQASLDLNFIFFPHITYKLKVESIEFIMHSVSGHFRLLKNCHFLINHSSLI